MNQYHNRFTSRYLWQALLAALLVASNISQALANDPPSPPIPESVVTMTTINPERDVAYTVGDIVERTIIQRQETIQTYSDFIAYRRV